MATSLHQLNNQTNDPVARSHAPSVKPLVLVVEDHDDTVFLLRYLLEIRGYRVMIAGDGETAVCLAEETCPDLILMDTSLPRLDGLAATRRIRELALLHDVPIVFLSGHAEASSRAKALETGGNDYLTKPFEIIQLERVLDRHLGSAGVHKAK